MAVAVVTVIVCKFALAALYYIYTLVHSRNHRLVQVFGISAFFQEAKKGGGALDGIGAGGGMGFGGGGGGVASNRSKIDFEQAKK